MRRNPAFGGIGGHPLPGDRGDYRRLGDIFAEILRQFEKNQIPCFIDYKKNILSNPMVELIRAALEVLQSGFPMNRCFDS